jgi:sodium/bile acid cotransporter 7
MITRLRTVLDPYVLLMLATVALAVVIPARGGGATIAGAAADIGVIFLFFLYGARLSPAAMITGMMHWRLHIAILACTFGLFPLLGLGLVALAPSSLPPALVMGLLYLSVLPSTVQSSIAFTSIAGGNVPAAICAASTSNLLGMFVSPLLAGWLLNRHGGAPSLDMFRDIALQLLVPFLAGQALRPKIAALVERHKAILGYADRGSILLIIYVAFSRGMVDGIWQRLDGGDLLLLLVMLAGLLAFVLLLTATIAHRVLRLDTADEIVLQFCGSKKSLASGLPMAIILFPAAQVSMIVLPLMIFHQLQLLACATLARHYARRRSSSGEPARQPG